MIKHRKRTKATPRVKKAAAKPKMKEVVVAPGEIVSVTVPPEHMPVVATYLDEGVVEIAPVKRKQGWWKTLLYGDDE